MSFTVEFRHAGSTWYAEVNELPQTIELDLENVIQEGRALSAEGTAKLLVLREGIKSLSRERKTQNLRDSKGNLRLPNVRDPETREGLITPCLKAVVKHNDYLGYVDPFKDVFERYLPDESDEANPTGQADTSQSGSITSLPIPQTPTQPPTPGGIANGS